MNQYRSIKELVIDLYNSEGSMPSYEKVTALVRQHFPQSRWKDSHYAWYKSQIKTGKMSVASEESCSDETEAGIEQEIEQSVEARLSIERDLRDYLAEHVSELEQGLTLRDGGVEFKTDAGYIDLLANDQRGNVVVIELKAGTGHDAALGQILGYIGCLSTDHQQVRGILVASSFDTRVVYACKSLPNLKLVRYKVSFGFESVA